MNIAVAGTGYVGLSIATLLAQHNHVTAVDYKQTVPGYSVSEIKSLMNWTGHAYGSWSDDPVLKRK